jgi:hypothetical protein
MAMMRELLRKLQVLIDSLPDVSDRDTERRKEFAQVFQQLEEEVARVERTVG